VASRPTVDISRELNRYPCIHLRADPRDLRIFIQEKIVALGLNAELQAVATKLLLRGAEQTFLWVSIILKKLDMATTLLSPAELKRIINETPTDLKELYDNIVRHVMQGTEAEQKLLLWLFMVNGL